MKKQKDIRKSDFKEDIKSNKGLNSALKKAIKTKKSPLKKDSSH
jgi:hypothetical protein